MKIILLIIAFAISIPSFSQKDEVLKKLQEYQFSDQFLVANLKDADADYFFNLKITTITSDETVIEQAKFDPTKNIGERWILLSTDGNTPTNKDYKKFDKAHNTKQKDINGKIDENAWAIEEDSDEYLVIRFKYDKMSLPKKYDFLGDCKGLAFFNKTTKRLEKAEFVNELPIKIKIFNVTKLDMIVNYIYNEEYQTYLISKESLDMEVKLLGQLVSIQELNEFSNYKKK